MVRERTGATAGGDVNRTPGDRARPNDAATRRFEERLAEGGGQHLADAVRRDPSDLVRAVLARTAVVDDLAAALALQADLPAGWSIVTRDGAAVVSDVAVRLGAGDTPLERRAQTERLRAEAARLEAEAGEAEQAAIAAAAAADDARRALDAATASEAQAAVDRRRVEEAERGAARDLDAALREASWHAAQVARLATDVDRARESSTAHETAGLWSRETHADDANGTVEGSEERADRSPSSPDADAVAAWERRAADLRHGRDRLAAQQASTDAERREAEARRARAEATVAMDEARLAQAERDLASLAERAERVADQRRTVATQLAVAADAERSAAAVLHDVRAAAASDRDRLGSAERDAAAARDRLRAADERLRSADRADLEARLGRDALREQVLVELAGLGELGRRRLEAEAVVVPVAVGPGRSATDLPASDSPASDRDSAALLMAPPGTRDGEAPDGSQPPVLDDGAALEAALDAAVDRWTASPPAGDPPGPGRLASLRRRYHELGAANPFAVEEYDEPPAAARGPRDAAAGPARRDRSRPAS